MIIQVTGVPSDFPDPPNLPWEHDEDTFCDWVWEVFLVGYRHTVQTLWGPFEQVGQPTLEEALTVVRAAGYTVVLQD